MTEPTANPNPNPQPTPSPTPGTGGDGGGQLTDWRTQLPEDLRAEKSLASFKDLGSLAKSYLESQKMIGGSIRLPKPDAPPEERQKFLDDLYGKLGRPESPDKYEIGTPTLPEGVPWDGEMQKEFLGVAHKAGLNSEQAAALLEWYAGKTVTAVEGMAQATVQVAETLKKEWGAQYDRNLALAQRVVSHLGGPDVLQTLDASGLGNDPALIRLFARVGRVMAEAQMIPGEVEGVPGPEEARATLAKIMSDPNHAYQPKFAGTPAHDEAIKEVQRLHELIFGMLPANQAAL